MSAQAGMVAVADAMTMVAVVTANTTIVVVMARATIWVTLMCAAQSAYRRRASRRSPDVDAAYAAASRLMSVAHGDAGSFVEVGAWCWV